MMVIWHVLVDILHMTALQQGLKAKLSDSRYNIAMENHEFGVAPEAFTKWIVLNDTYDILSTSKDRSVLPVLLLVTCLCLLTAKFRQ